MSNVTLLRLDDHMSSIQEGFGLDEGYISSESEALRNGRIPQEETS